VFFTCVHLCASVAKDHTPRLQPKKRFGQHFLHDQGIVQRILDAFDPQPDETLVEIGPGPGALTRPLLERCALLHVVELDRDLAARLRAGFDRSLPARSTSSIPGLVRPSRLSGCPAYVRRSRLTMRASPSRRAASTKFAPMKPAPPVTSQVCMRAFPVDLKTDGRAVPGAYSSGFFQPWAGTSAHPGIMGANRLYGLAWVQDLSGCLVQRPAFIEGAVRNKKAPG